MKKAAPGKIGGLFILNYKYLFAYWEWVDDYFKACNV